MSYGPLRNFFVNFLVMVQICLVGLVLSDESLEIVKNVRILLLQEEISNSVNIQVEKREFTEVVREERYCNETDDSSNQANSIYKLTRDATIILNSDAATRNSTNKIGLGTIAKKRQDQILAIWAESLHQCFVAKVAEASALRLAMIKSKKEGWVEVYFQTSYKQLLDEVRSEEKWCSPVGIVIEDIIQLQQIFSRCIFSFIKRDENQVSHELAKLIIKLKYIIKWKASFPTWLNRKVRDDLRVIII
ncbi:hypothetical protein ACH5RR_015761 [Cinchona calisaya]|uniref:RNase H type-1 domain-containing protein n=1 Tax=Cinchona calisaya TaxID=153742 RepID=A0ABD2ZU26_9GENT